MAMNLVINVVSDPSEMSGAVALFVEDVVSLDDVDLSETFGH